MGSPRDRAELGPQPGPWPAEAPHLFSVAVLPAGGEETEVRAAAAAAKTREPDAGHGGTVREQHGRAAAAAGTALLPRPRGSQLPGGPKTLQTGEGV